MSHNIELGKAPGEDAKRDAIHIAVIPVIAHDNLMPAERILIDYYGYAKKTNEDYGPQPNAIVDPFAKSVEKGSRFWAVMLPGQTKNLRHAWSHEGFPDEEEGGFGDDGCRGCH